MKILERTVYPSAETTIGVHEDDIYGGAHEYQIKHCLGFNNGKTEYSQDPEGYENIHFIKKLDDGVVIPGVQSEQLVIMLIDRQKKLNSRFPSPFSDKAIKGLEMFLEAQEDRVKDRMQRGVMGALKK